jgi:hypothetical protein
MSYGLLGHRIPTTIEAHYTPTCFLVFLKRFDEAEFLGNLFKPPLSPKPIDLNEASGLTDVMSE